ncbi:MAG: phosphate signaling complex protein PhoU [Traorella sp.]
MRKQYDEQLKQLNNELINMGDLCKVAITYALNSIKNPTEEIKEMSVTIENEINQKERSIEQLCMKLLLQQQPVAGDLRLISSALKMISDMERIGDQAYDISLIYLEDLKNDSKLEKHILGMAKSSIDMVTKSIESFVNRDLDEAKKVIQSDDIVDDYFNAVKNDLIKAIQQEGLSALTYLDVLMIAKYLERIGDHATNIAEWVEYSITGEFKKPTVKKID